METKRKPDAESLVTAAIGLLFMAGLLLMLCGCGTAKKAVRVEKGSVLRDTVRLSVVRTDSVFVRDSIFVREKGDTVRIERWRTEWRDRLVRDTLFSVRRDSVRTEVPAEAEKPARWYDQLFLWAGKAALGLLVAWIAILCLKLRKKRV